MGINWTHEPSDPRRVSMWFVQNGTGYNRRVATNVEVALNTYDLTPIDGEIPNGLEYQLQLVPMMPGTGSGASSGMFSVVNSTPLAIPSGTTYVIPDIGLLPTTTTSTTMAFMTSKSAVVTTSWTQTTLTSFQSTALPTQAALPPQSESSGSSFDSEAKIGLGGGLVGGAAFVVVIVVSVVLLRRYWRKQQATRDEQRRPEAPVPRSPEIPMTYELEAVGTSVPAELPGYHELNLTAPTLASSGVSPATAGAGHPPPAPAAERHNRKPSERSFTARDDAHLIEESVSFRHSL